MRSVLDRSAIPQLGPSPSRLLLLVLLVLGLTACQSFNVRSDWDDTVSFDGFKRYFWLEPPVAEGADPFADNDLLRKRVRKAIETTLAGRGFQPVSRPEDADFLVTYGVQLEDKLRVNGSSGVYGGYGGYGGYGRWPTGIGIGVSTTDVRNYQEAILIVDFLSPEKEELVWRGWGSGFLQTRDRDRGQKRFEAGVQAVLARFPPETSPR